MQKFRNLRQNSRNLRRKKFYGIGCAKFHHFGKYLKNWQYILGFFGFGESFKLTLAQFVWH